MTMQENFTGRYCENTDEGQIIITFVNGLKDGITQFVAKDGVVLSEVEYKNDVIHGISRQYYQSGNVLSTTYYENGKPNGKFTAYYESGIKQLETDYLNGEIHGAFITYDEFGDKISECFYHNGKKHGENVLYYSKSNGGGVSETSHYENGLINGDKISLYPGGEILSITPYIDGKPQEYTKTYDKSGNLM